MKRYALTAALVATFLFGVTGSSSATPITGGISFGGNGTPIGDPTDWFSATGVDFGANWFVVDGTGDYSGVPIPTLASFTDISWGSGSDAVNVPLSQTIWTFSTGGLTYTLTAGSVTDIDRGDAVNDNISVNGAGTLTITGPGVDFDATPGDWNFTAGFAGRVANLSFSASPVETTTADVPEPTSLMLLGAGLTLAGARLRRLRKNKN